MSDAVPAENPPADAPPAEGEAPPAAEEAPVVEKKEPVHLKTWKAAEKPVNYNQHFLVPILIINALFRPTRKCHQTHPENQWIRK